MEYYRILNLVREPFSNSPEPEFFFQSPKHIGCLQKLELAIRLRRGLNVVMGHVGTGKTTLCRHLIRQFATANEEADAVETYLLMDPAFSTPQEFLTTIAIAFGIAGKRKRKSATDTDPSEWQIKEHIKTYLYKKGVDEKKVVALIVDEGQKLPDFCLEILREFLNYETNENKLLQIVIFGQEELQLTLNRLPNLADRVNLLYLLEPLNFKETRDMIRFRIARAADPEQIPALFTHAGLLAVYLATRGYPRKIITLCHQVMLALIIRNQSRAGWPLVRSCAARLPETGKLWPSWQLRWISGILIALLAVLMLVFVMPVQTDSLKKPSVAPQGSQSPAPAAVPQGSKQAKQDIAPQTAIPDKPAPQPSVKPPPAIRHPKPDFLGKVVLKDGRTVWWLLSDFYGQYDQDIFRSVARANPQIKNLNRVNAGATIRLPAMPAKGNPLPAGQHLVQLSASGNIEEIYERYRTYKQSLPSVRFLVYWNPGEGVVFSIFMRNGYPDAASAGQAMAALPAGARVLKDLDKETVFYTR
ncbi:MAG: AAA family ATPase [Pseudomonadota bacterium]